MRITKSNLETMFQTFVREVLQGDWKYSKGGYQLDGNSGKWGISRISNNSGGITIIIPVCNTKKELYEKMEFAVQVNRHVGN